MVRQPAGPPNPLIHTSHGKSLVDGKPGPQEGHLARSANKILLERKDKFVLQNRQCPEMRRRLTEYLLEIWTGCHLSAQRSFSFPILLFTDLFEGGAYLHQLHLHWHAHGEEHIDGICLPQDQGVLSWEARTGVPGLDIFNLSFGLGHALSKLKAETLNECHSS